MLGDEPLSRTKHFGKFAFQRHNGAMSEDFSQHPPPTLHDWLMLAIGIVFVAMGLVILPSKPDVGIVTLAMFGTCLVVFAAIIGRKLRTRKFTASKVDVVGGIPIRPNKALMVVMGLWMLALGLIMIVYGYSYPLLFRVIAAFVAVVGVVLFVGAALGKWPGGYLQFDPDCLTIARRRWSARIPWHSIAAVHEAEYHSNPVLLIAVPDLAAIAIEPASATAGAFKAIAKMQTYMGAEFAIMSTHYGIDLPVLAAAVTRYASAAAARKELGQRLL